MTPIITLAKKELRGLLYSPSGYIFSGLMAGLAIWLFSNDLFLLGQADVGPLVSTMSYLLTLFVPAVAMGIIAEEKKNGTWENLMTWPITEWQVVTGKFLGYGIYLIISLGLIVPIMASMVILGFSEIGLLFSNFLMLVLLSWCFLGVTLVASSLSSQPMVALAGSLIFLLVNSLLGNGSLTSRLDPNLQNFFTQLSLSWRTQRLGSGLIELGNLWFLVTFLVGCLIAATLIIRGRNR
ncbi:MAG: ABC transporter permease subunit [Candidatus Shapirobacteria bacterium]